MSAGSGAPGGPPGGGFATAGLSRILIQNAQIVIQNAQMAGGHSYAPGPSEPSPDPAGPPGTGRPPGSGRQPGGGAYDRVTGFISNTASTATGVALGGGILSFLVGAGEQFKATDKALTALEARFDSVGRGAASFAGKMGYLRSETAGYLETLGAQTNAIDMTQAGVGLGFARFRGLDPSRTMSFVGRTSRLSGFSTDAMSMQRVFGQARSLGQGEGMLPEFMDALQSLQERQFAATGRPAGLNSAQGLMQIPSLMFGEGDPRAMGMGAVDTVNSIHGMLAGGDPSMRVALLRSMRFGKKGGPGYLDAMERLEAGVFDSRNLRDLMGRLRGEGRSADEAATMLLPTARAAGMRTSTLRALTSRFMSDEGFAQLEAAGDSWKMGEAFDASFRGGLTDKEAKIFGEKGFEGLGEGATGQGNIRERQFEDLTMKVGPKMLKSMMDLTRTADNIGGAIDAIVKKITGGSGVLDVLNGSTDALERFTGAVNDAAHSSQFVVPMGAGSMPAQVTEGDFWGNMENILRKRVLNEDNAPLGAR